MVEEGFSEKKLAALNSLHVCFRKGLSVSKNLPCINILESRFEILYGSITILELMGFAFFQNSEKPRDSKMARPAALRDVSQSTN